MVEYTRGGVTAVGIKNFTINEYFFPGHFPGKPIVPGVILIEAMAQVGGILIQPETAESNGTAGWWLDSVANRSGADPYEEVWFRKPVVSGDTLVLRMTIFKLHKRLTLEGKAYVEGELVCKADFFYISW
ncbi:hypothetical protein ACLB2K_047153 [Fragaria x ananassa]